MAVPADMDLATPGTMITLAHTPPHVCWQRRGRGLCLARSSMIIALSARANKVHSARAGIPNVTAPKKGQTESRFLAK
jgi:hypothetical protein